MSWLNSCVRWNTAKQRVHQKPKTTKGQPTTNNKKGIVSKYQNKITEHVTEHVRYLSDETRVVVFKIQTYWIAYLSPHPYSIWTRLDWTHVWLETLQDRVHQKKKDQPTTNNKSTVSNYKTTKQSVWDICQMKLGTYWQTQLRLLRYIVVTALVFHFETSELNACAPSITELPAPPQNRFKT